MKILKLPHGMSCGSFLLKKIEERIKELGILEEENED